MNFWKKIKRTEPLDLYRRYSFEDYPKYSNFDANVNKVSEES